MDNIKSTFKALWEGNVSLAQTFWLYYVVAMFVLRTLASAVSPMIGFLILGWAAFMVMPIWRASDKYTGPAIFSLLAKIAAVIVALSVLGTLF